MNKIIFPHAAYWLFLLTLALAIGVYHSYWSRNTGINRTVTHPPGCFMTLCMIMIMVQLNQVINVESKTVASTWLVEPLLFH